MFSNKVGKMFWAIYIIFRVFVPFYEERLQELLQFIGERFRNFNRVQYICINIREAKILPLFLRIVFLELPRVCFVFEGRLKYPAGFKHLTIVTNVPCLCSRLAVRK